jgi:hypothetical protein
VGAWGGRVIGVARLLAFDSLIRSRIHVHCCWDYHTFPMIELELSKRGVIGDGLFLEFQSHILSRYFVHYSWEYQNLQIFDLATDRVGVNEKVMLTKKFN